MVVRLYGGNNAVINPTMLIFRNKSRSYPIRGFPDDVPGVCYRSSPKAWMDGVTWRVWMTEPRALPKVNNDKKWLIYVDNCSSHKIDGDVPELLEKSSTEICKFPAQANELVKEADSFVIKMIKESWRRLWDKYRLEAVKNGLSNDRNNPNGSGRLDNPG